MICVVDGEMLPSRLQNRTIGRGKVPAYVVVLSVFAATGGLMFGYDIGVSGGVTMMDEFLCQFFPHVLSKKLEKIGPRKVHIKNCPRISATDWNAAAQKSEVQDKKGTLYCIFCDQRVQVFTSSLYLAAMVATFFAAYVSRHKGRKMTIIVSSIFYIVGVVLNIVAGSIQHQYNVAFCMLIFGRIMLGIGVGFGNQAVPLFISEIAPREARGSLNYLFQLNVTIGILSANIVNWVAIHIHPWGWRLSLGVAGIPAVLLAIGSCFLIETPSSFVQRGRLPEAKGVLSLIRGRDIDAEVAIRDIMGACSTGIANDDNVTEDDPFKDTTNVNAGRASIPENRFNGLFTRSNVPPLSITIFVQLFQQFSGINVVMLYAPVLLSPSGSNTHTLLMFVVIIASCNVLATFCTIMVVDRIGRRRLVLVASATMFFTQLLIWILLKGMNEHHHLWNLRVVVLVTLVCIFVSAFACSWGPLGWLIATEIFPLACRSEGQSATVFFNMLFTFVIAHSSLDMLCTMKYGLFFFYAILAVIMGFSCFLFLPETRNMDIEIIWIYIWRYHKIWKHFFSSQNLPPTSPYEKPQQNFLHLEMGDSNMHIRQS